MIDVWVTYRVTLMLIAIWYLFCRLFRGMRMRDCSSCIYYATATELELKVDICDCKGNCS